MFEGHLQAAESGDGSWAGTLAPVATQAARLAAWGNTEGQLQLLPTADGGTRVVAYLEDMPPGRTLTVCLGSVTG